MSLLPKRLAGRLAGTGLGVLTLVAALPAFAADLAYPPYPADELNEPPPPPRPVYGPRFAAGPYGALPPPEECRIIVRRRIDAFGELVERRVRICDEPAYPPGPRFQSSFHRPPPPLPPADIPEDGWAGPPRW